MNRPPFLARLALLTPLLLVAALLHPGTSGAQYIFLDANDDGVHTDADVLNPSGATHVAVWLDTSHDRDGTLRSCNSHTGAPVGSETDTDVFSYDLYLVADHGTVDWGTYQDRVAFQILPNDDQNTRTPTAIHIVRMADLNHEKPAGRYKLGTLTISCVAGTASIRFGTMENWDFTGFGTHCDASRDYPNTYLLGIDFFDADGLDYGGPINHEPVFQAVAPVTVIQNRTADAALAASDEDIQPLTFTMLSGPAFVTVSNGPNNGEGVVHAAPGGTEMGTFMVELRVSDGVFWTDRIMPVTVRRELTIARPPDVTVMAGSIYRGYMTADNPLGAQLNWYLVSGPAFVKVVHPEALSPPAPGPNLGITPSSTDVGTWTVRVGVTNGNVQDEATFQVTVTATPPEPPPGSLGHPPVAIIQGPSQTSVGRTILLNGGTSYDPDGDKLSFSWNFGDGSPVSTDWRAKHVFTAERDYRVDLAVYDGTYYRLSSLAVSVFAAAAARAFVADRAGSGDLEVRVEPIGGSFDVSELTAGQVASFSLSNEAGHQALAIGLDPSVQDADRNGIPERVLTFAAGDVAVLTAGAGAHGVVPLTVRGALDAGGQFVASLVVRNGRSGPLSASLAPNPMNPVGKLSFVTTRTGRTDVRVYDVRGRLVHHPLDGTTLPAGYHELLVGRGHFGEDLPSGLYFYRVETDEGVARGRFAIVR